MLAEASLRVLEMVAVLLSILFVAVQFGSRQAESSKISNESLYFAMENVDAAATMLLFASMASILAYMSVHGIEPAYIVFLPLFLALLSISLSIREAAREIKSSLRERGDSFNTSDSQSDTTEDHGE